MKCIITSQKQSAFTLVELMVTLFITVSIVGILGSILLSQQKSVFEFQSILETQSPAQAACDLIRQDIMQAGFGSLVVYDENEQHYYAPEDMRSHTKNLAFYIKDGDLDDDGSSELPDKLFLFDSSYIDYHELKNVFFSDIAYAVIDSPLSTKQDTVTVNSLDLDKDKNNTCYCSNSSSCSDCDEFAGGINQYIITDYPFLDLGSSSEPGDLKVAKINSISSNQLSLDSAIKGTRIAPAIYYCVDYDGNDSSCHPSSTDITKVLRRSDRSTGGRQPIISDIVDMQIAYKDNDGWWYCCDTDDAFTGSDYSVKCADDDKRPFQTPCKCQKKDLDGHYVCPMNPFYPDEITSIQVTLITKTDDIEGNATISSFNGRDWSDGHYSLTSFEVRPRNSIDFNE